MTALAARQYGARWIEWLQLAVVAASTWAGVLLLPAPSALDSTARPWPTPVAVTLLGVFIVVAQRRWPTTFDSTQRGAILIACLVLALGGSMAYFVLVESWTCSYYSEARVTGSTLTPFAADYLRREPISCEELLKRFTGRSDEIWTRSSSLPRQLLLSALHLCVVSAGVVFALLATRLLVEGRRGRPALAPARALEAPGLGPAASERLLPLAVTLSRLVLAHETILRHAQTVLRAPELVEIPSPANARALWLAVLQRAKSEGAVVRLVDVVLDENPAADELRAVVQDWLPRELARPRASHPS